MRLAWAGIVLAVALGVAAPSHAEERAYVADRGVSLGPEIADAIDRIAIEFHRRTGRDIYVTSGTRSADQQAQAMYDKLRFGQRLTRLYRDYRAASEIQRAYRRHRRSGRRACVGAMARVIRTQMGRGRFISRHLRASAADVRSRDMTRRQRRIFRDVVRAVGGVRLLEEGTPPHFHLQID